ncbi:MAG: GNAT family N-acetyltransferase [Solirubrobacteraceae bacterium]
MPIELHTERLILRAPTPDDLDGLHAGVFGDADAMSFSSHGPAHNLAESRTWLERHVEHERKHGFAMGPVIERDTGETIGFAGLLHLEFVHPDVELGYRLNKRAWGRGLATEAGRAWVRHGLRQLNLPRVVAVVDPANAASRRVLEKCGMYEAGHGRHYGAELLVYRVERSRCTTTPASASR